MGVAECGVGQQKLLLVANPLRKRLRANLQKNLTSSSLRCGSQVIRRYFRLGPRGVCRRGWNACKTVHDNIGCIGEQFRGSVLTNREFEQVGGFVDKPGGAETFLEFLGVDHVQKERNVGFYTTNPELFQRSFHAPDGIDESATTS